MKLSALILSVCLLGSTTSAFASEMECSITNDGGAITQVAIMQSGDFLSIENQGRHQVYSCGSFVNDGTVPVDHDTFIVEMSIPSCVAITTTSPNYLLYCR